MGEGGRLLVVITQETLSAGSALQPAALENIRQSQTPQKYLLHLLFEHLVLLVVRFFPGLDTTMHTLSSSCL